MLSYHSDTSTHKNVCDLPCNTMSSGQNMSWADKGSPTKLIAISEESHSPGELSLSSVCPASNPCSCKTSGSTLAVTGPGTADRHFASLNSRISFSYHESWIRADSLEQTGRVRKCSNWINELRLHWIVKLSSLS
jgi:hypothetical protein